MNEDVEFGEELGSGRINPAKEFYLALICGPKDGSHAVDWDGNKGYQTEKMALACLREDVDEAGGEFMLYRCVPVKRIFRGRTKIISYKSR